MSEVDLLSGQGLAICDHSESLYVQTSALQTVQGASECQCEWRFLGPVSATNDVVTPMDACNDVLLVDLRVSCRQKSHILEK
jgi:hypothetical protein